MTVKVGLIDGPVGTGLAHAVLASSDPQALQSGEGGHGRQVACALLEHCPTAGLLLAPVFDRTREAEVGRVVDALHWLAAQGAQLINLSFSMAVPSRRLASACAEVATQGVLLVASAPARGAPVYPAAFADCIAVTGDARCAPGEVSWLSTAAADFGTHPLIRPGRPDLGGGASIATARMSGLLAALLEEGHAPHTLRARLQSMALHIGPERRHA